MIKFSLLPGILALGTCMAPAYDSVVVFNEIQYAPAAEQQEFIELRNLNGVDVNLAGWEITSGVDFVFPENTVIPGHGYLLIGAVPGAVGAFTGSLNNAGETIRLRNRSGRIMDELTYEDAGDWPPGADGTGFTLSRRTADAAEGAAAWTVSGQRGGTPGDLNFLTVPVDRQLVTPRSTWKYRDAAEAPPTDWKAREFNDTAWPQGNGVLGTTAGGGPVTLVTANLVERFRAGAVTGVADGGVVATLADAATGDGVSQNATANGTTPTLRLNATPSGKAALRFDGNDELRTTALPGIPSTGGFTYFIVCKANGAQSSGTVSDGSGAYLFDRHLTGAGAPLVSLKASSGFYALQRRHDDSSSLGGPSSTSAISTSAFQIVTVRRNRTLNRFEIWVNGAMQGTEPDSGAALTPDPIVIGRHGTVTTGGYVGDIAEVLIYRTELTPEDFQLVGAYLETEYGLDTAFTGSTITTPISPAAPTSYFRRSFTYPGDPSRTALQLEYTQADGAVFYLNGTELHRNNMPAVLSAHDTPASGNIAAPVSSGSITVPSTTLLSGTNVLAVSLHKGGGSSDALFDASLNATEQPPDTANEQRLVLSEVSGAGDAGFFVELRNVSPAPLNTSGWTLVSSTSQSVALPAQVLAPGAWLTLDAAALGFTPADGTRLSVLSPGGTRLTDAQLVTARPRGLTADGKWGHPTAATPGSANVVAVNTDIVINEIFYSALNKGPEQWIELYNKGAAPVDVGGWKLSDAVSWQFPPGTTIPADGYAVIAWDPAAFAVLHPGKTAYGPWTSSLSGKGETITLRDAADNIADQVRYADSGRWSQWADGGGSSLELKDPKADNSAAEAWDSSDESLATGWQTVTYSGPATHATTNANANYHEFVMGLLDEGEYLIDDISVKEVSQGNRELIQNGNFSGGTADKWRNIGTHRLSTVVDDPFSPGNKVLRVVSSGATEHMHNHSGTTLKSGATYVAINTGSTYNISFRAKWLKGSNRLHTRLFFNRLAKQTLLTLPATGGTPGAVNSRRTANAGPTFAGLGVAPVVPPVSQPATVSIAVSDPDGLAAVELYTSVNGAAFTSAPMTGSGGVYSAVIPGKASGTQVQFYVRAADSLGSVSTFPAEGAASRAMIPWQDGRSQLVLTNGARPHNIRVVLPAADANTMYLAENVQSNEYRPCTVILDENRAWYQSAVRLKSSEHGRFQQNRVGYNLKFGSDDLFFGAHATVSIDRSGNRTTEGLDGSTVTSQREILMKSVMNAAGGIYSMEDDLIRVIAPVASGSPAPVFNGSLATGQAILSKSRFDDEYLDGQWDNGGSGAMFKQEYIYPLTQTINPSTRAVATIGATGNLDVTAEYPKIAQTSGAIGPSGIEVRAYTPPSGIDAKENYRWHWLIRNGRSTDDYSGLISAVTAVGQAQGSAAFKSQTEAALDVDVWLRAATVAQMFGVSDNFLGDGSTHNFILYFPPGGKGIAIPWDLDYLAQGANTNAGFTNGGLISKFIAIPQFRRRYYGHVLDVLNRTFNDTYLTKWATHYSRFGVDDMTSSLTFLRARATYIRNVVTGQGQTAPIPAVAFTRTSAATMSVTTPFATVSGDGWIDVDAIRLAGSPEPLNVTWTDDNSWTLQLPVQNGTRAYTLEAVRKDGTVAGTVTVTVTATGGIAPAAADNTVVSRLHYHPADPTAGEAGAGYTSSDDFEYIELQNISTNIVDLSNCRFDSGITYTFAAGAQIAPGGRLVIPRRTAAFALRHPGVTTAAQYFIASDPTGNQFSNGGESVSIIAAGGADIKRFTYDDANPWPEAADGPGRALALISPAANPDHNNPLSWRASLADGGSPGTAEGSAFTGNAAADTNNNGLSDLIDFAIGTGNAPGITFNTAGGSPSLILTVDRDMAARASFRIELSTDLSAAGPGGWAAAAGANLQSRTPLGGTMERLVFLVPMPAGAGRGFVRTVFLVP